MPTISRRALLAGASTGSLRAARKQPNIVFLFSDDHHYQCLGAAQNPHIHTPNLDRLAARGVHFTNGMISTPQCCPSRGIILSGLETYQSGLRSNGQTGFREGLGPPVVEQLRRGGYETTLIGKWHIQPGPGECGFTNAPLWLRGGGSPYLNPRLRSGFEGGDQTVEGHITDLLTGAAVSYLGQARRPFLLWLSYNAPHTPWYADGRYRARYDAMDQRSIAPPGHPPGGADFDWISYYSVITHLDEAVGRVLAELERRDLWKNTLVLFVGDNGYLCGTKGLSGKVYPWEESIRVPYLAAGGMVKRGVRCDAPVASVDLPATWLDLAGIRPEYPLAGRSLRRVLETGKADWDEAYATWDDGRPEALAVRRAVEPYRLVRTRRHKYIAWESGKRAMFDCVADPGEENNLADAETRIAAGLREKLRARMRATGDPAISWKAVS